MHLITTFRPPRASHGRLGTWISELSVLKNHLPASNPEMKICQILVRGCYRARRKPSPVVPVPHGPSLVMCQPYVHQSSGRSLSALPHSSCPRPSMAEVCGLAQLSYHKTHALLLVQNTKPFQLGIIHHPSCNHLSRFNALTNKRSIAHLCPVSRHGPSATHPRQTSSVARPLGRGPNP